MTGRLRITVTACGLGNLTHMPDIEVVLGDITDENVDAIVNAANSSLRGGAGVDGAIHRAAGPRLADAGARLAPCEAGDAKVTPAFGLEPRIKHVIHTVGPVWHGGQRGEPETLASCYRRSLAVADELGASTVAFPSISTGLYGYPADQAARIAVRTLRQTPTRVERIRLVAFDEQNRDHLAAALAEPARPPEVIDAGPAILRRWRLDDLDELYQATVDSHDHLRPWMPWAEIISRDGTESFLAESLANWENGTEFNYAIISGGRIAGSIGLMARIGLGGLEIGYWVHEAYTRRGLATAGARALAEAAFALPGIDHVEIVHDELNTISGAVPRKLGFTKTGTQSLDNPPSAGTGTGVVWRLDSPERRV